MARLVGYTRVSRMGKRRADDNSFISLDQQRDAIKAYAKAHGHRIVKWTEPDLDESGGSLERPGFQHALEMVRAGRADGIIGAKLDRLVRHVGKLGELLDEAKVGGWNLIAVDLGLDASTSNGRLIWNLLGSIAEWYLEATKAGWADAQERAVERGIHIAPRVPVGYKRNGERQLEPDPKFAPHIAEVFRRRAQGASWKQLADYLNEAKVPTYSGGQWTISSVRSLTLNRAYTGQARGGTSTNDDAHTPIVSVAEFAAANARKGKQRAVRSAEGALMSGLVYCVSCGGRMVADLGRSNGKVHRQYRCRKRTHGTNGCDRPATIAGYVLEPYVIEAFLGGLEGLEFGISGDRDPEKEELQRQLADTEHVLEVLLEDPASLAALRPSERAKLLNGAAEARDAALAALGDATARQPKAMLPATVPLPEFYESLSIPERRELLGYAIERIPVKPGRGSASERVTIVERGSEFDSMSDAEFARWAREHAA